MTEAMIMDAVSGVRPVEADAAMQVGAVQPVPDAASVERFQSVMGVDDVSEVAAIPFASEATAAWRTAQANNQELLHRIRALSQMRGDHAISAAEMVELQYDVMNLSFQQEVVTKVVDKSSNAIQTLIKNQ